MRRGGPRALPAVIQAMVKPLVAPRCDKPKYLGQATATLMLNMAWLMPLPSTSSAVDQPGPRVNRPAEASIIPAS